MLDITISSAYFIYMEKGMQILCQTLKLLPEIFQVYIIIIIGRISVRSPPLFSLCPV